jgi:hypothetical protein
MNRSAAIATVVAATGVLVAGSIASVAVINAASSSEPVVPSVALVADGTTGQDQAAAASDVTASDATASGLDSGMPAASDLPELPEVPDLGESSAAPDSRASEAANAEPTEQADSGQPAATAAPVTTTVTYTVTSSDAARKVVTKTGGTVLSVSKATRGGYKAWAVRVQMTDGSVVTGYVDRASGVVFDWVTNQAAPAPAGNTGYDDDSDDHDEDESDHDEDDDQDDHEDEQENEDHDEHEGDDD